MSVNKVILVGNLGRDPEVRFTAGGKAVAFQQYADTLQVARVTGVGAPA